MMILGLYAGGGPEEKRHHDQLTHRLLYGPVCCALDVDLSEVQSDRYRAAHNRVRGHNNLGPFGHRSHESMRSPQNQILPERDQSQASVAHPRFCVPPWHCFQMHDESERDDLVLTA